jgi:hypothetical protein
LAAIAGPCTPRFLPDHVAELHILGAFGAVEVMLFEFEAFDLGHLVEEVPFRGQSVE